MKTKSIKINGILSAVKQVSTVLFPIVTIPYISRVLGNENYGKVNFGNSIVSYFILLAGLGVTAYAIREGSRIRDDKEKFQKFANEVFTINVFTTLVSYIILGLLLVFWRGIENYRLIIILQSVPIIFITLGIDWANNIYEDFFYTTVRYLVIQILSIVGMFVFVKDENDFLIYVAITSFANIGGNIVNIFYISKNYVKVKICRVNNVLRHLVPMVYLFGNMLASTIYANSDITILTLLKGDAVTGIYSVAVKVSTIIKQFINAVISVALPRLSSYLGTGDLESYNSLLNKLLHTVITLILPSSVGLFILSKDIINIIAGPEYISGYIALRILVVALSLGVLSFFFVYSVMIPNGLEKYTLIYTGISAVINVILNFTFIPALGMNGAAITTVVAEGIVLILSAYRSRGMYEISLKIKQLLPCLVGCLGIIIISTVAQEMIEGSISTVIVAVSVSGLFYLIVMVAMKDEIIGNTAVNAIKSIIKKVK